MTSQEYQQMEAEKAFLAQQLQELPITAGLTKRSLQVRFDWLLEKLREQVVEPTSVLSRITFRGRPVVGQHGIYSDFALKAMGAFTDSIATLAASFTTALAAVGPLPFRDQNQFLITGVVKGSFGFELEEKPTEGQLSLEPTSPVSQAVERFQLILESTMASDDELAESVADLDHRALEKVRIFLQTLSDGEALCNLEHRDKTISFNSLAEVRTSVARLASDNIHEEAQEISGRFIGVLPRSRTFEFVRSDTDEVVRGKILASIPNVDQINQRLEVAVTAQFTVTTAGRGRPRFTLTQYPWEQPAI